MGYSKRPQGVAETARDLASLNIWVTSSILPLPLTLGQKLTNFLINSIVTMRGVLNDVFVRNPKRCQLNYKALVGPKTRFLKKY